MKVISVDTEGTGLTLRHGCRAFMIQLCDGEFNHWWIGQVNPYDRTDIKWDKDDLLEFLDICLDADKIIFHNAKYDIRSIWYTLQAYGLEKGWINLVFSKFEDTMIGCHCICPGDSVALKHNAFKYCDYYNDNEHHLALAIQQQRDLHPEYDLARVGHPTFGGSTKASWWKADYWLDIDACIAYGLDDVEMTLLLWDFVYEGMKSEGLLSVYETRKKVLRTFYDIEDTGMNMYSERVEETLEELEMEQTRLVKKIRSDQDYRTSLDLSTDEDKHFLLHHKLGLPVKFFTATGKPSVKKEAIDYYIRENPDNETLQDFKLYRSVTTQISDIKSFESWKCDDSRLHSNYWLTGTRNTRQSASDPAIQTIGKKIRKLFGPPQGYVWLDYDLVNIEMRRWAYYVGNPELTAIFDTGGSVHLLIAETLYPREYAAVGEDFKYVYEDTLYQWVKNGNFSALYGAGERKADATYQLPGAYRKIAERFPEVPGFTKACEEEVRFNFEQYNQPCLTVDGGFRTDVPLSEAYKAVNYKVQGSAGWIIGESMIDVANNVPFPMINQLHDGLPIEVPREAVTMELILSIKEVIERSGLRYMPTSEASYKIHTHYAEPEFKVINNELIELPF